LQTNAEEGVSIETLINTLKIFGREEIINQVGKLELNSDI